jgi:hypothetical protein
MRNLGILLLTLILFSCSSSKISKSWRNPEYDSFNPKNILVIGVTPNLEARTAFELQIKNELNARKINALQSTIVFEKAFQNSEQSELEIQRQIDKILSAGYDAILISAVKGVDTNIMYSGSSPNSDYRMRKFIIYYLIYQEAYFRQDYYKQYKVFHIETNMFDLKKDSEKALVWTATFDIVNPHHVERTIDNYVKAVIKSLEKEELIPEIN